MNKILVSSFYTVTDSVEKLILEWEEEGKKSDGEFEYLLVMTDALSPFITEIRRRDFLSKTLLRKEFPIEFTAINEGMSEDFVDAIKGIAEEHEGAELFIQTNYEDDDWEELDWGDLEFTLLDAPKGDVLAKVKEYRRKSSDAWNTRCGQDFEDIITLNVSHYSHDSYLVVPYFKTEGGTLFLMGQDLVTDEVAILDSYTDDIELLPIMAHMVSENLGSTAIDWDIRVFVENNVSYSVVLLEVEDSELLQEMRSGNELYLADEDMVYVFGTHRDYRSTNLRRAWIGEKIDDIEDIREKEKEIANSL